MIISASKGPSSVTALKDVLREAFPLYTVKFFGFKDQSIMIGKSPFVGVQISKRENDITVLGTGTNQHLEGDFSIAASKSGSLMFMVCLTTNALKIRTSKYAGCSSHTVNR